MKARRRIVTFFRRVSGAGRVLLAVALLAVVFVATVKTVDVGSRAAVERRANDRAAVTAGFATSIDEWIDAGRSEVNSLSRQVGSLPRESLSPTISAYLATRRIFTRNVIVFLGQTVVSGSGRLQALTGIHPKPCTLRGDSSAVQDQGLDALVSAARASSEPVISQIFDVPGECRPAIAVATKAGPYVLAALGDLSDATARLQAGSLIADQVNSKDLGTRVYLVTGPVALEPRLEIVSVPAPLANFVRSAAKGGGHVTRYSLGSSAAEVVATYAPVIGGNAVVLEQDAALFDVEPQNRPSYQVAGTLTVVFAIVFALLAFFDIRRARERRRADAAKNTFFSIAGHELRTPLTVLTGFADTLSNHWDQLAEKNRRALVDRMTPQTRRLDRLVQRLLVAASIQAETHARPVLRGVDVFPVLHGVVERFAPEAPLHDFRLKKNGSDLIAEADPEALASVIDHLVDNAVKYSPSGGRVWVRATGLDKTIEISVEDEGIGLQSDHRHIFDMFVQGESVTKRVHDEGGVGLGLFIARTLVTEMGGSIRAEPREPQGARFVVSLVRSRTSAGVTSDVVLRRDAGLVRNQRSRTHG